VEAPSSGIERQYTPVEIASLMKVQVKTVRGWLRDPKHPLKGVHHRNMWRVSESELGKFLKGQS
jgi:hypothetical protein